MDNRKEHNRWLTFYKHWRFLVMAMVVVFSALLPLPVFSHLRILVTLKGMNLAGTFSRDTGSVYWCVLSRPETNEIQFVLLLPVTTTMELGNDAAWPDDGNDYCILQVKSNRHQWKIENVVDRKTGVQTVQLRDMTANTNSVLSLDKGRFWQLDDAAHTTRLETIDAATLARIMSEIKTNETNLQTP
jgi:hypothetical protein